MVASQTPGELTKDARSFAKASLGARDKAKHDG